MKDQRIAIYERVKQYVKLPKEEKEKRKKIADQKIKKMVESQQKKC